jgi:hypothetical protein
VHPEQHRRAAHDHGPQEHRRRRRHVQLRRDGRADADQPEYHDWPAAPVRPCWPTRRSGQSSTSREPAGRLVAEPGPVHQLPHRAIVNLPYTLQPADRIVCLRHVDSATGVVVRQVGSTRDGHGLRVTITVVASPTPTAVRIRRARTVPSGTTPIGPAAPVGPGPVTGLPLAVLVESAVILLVLGSLVLWGRAGGGWPASADRDGGMMKSICWRPCWSGLCPLPRRPRRRCTRGRRRW